MGCFHTPSVAVMDLNPSKKSIHNLNSRRIIVITVAALVLMSTEAIFPDGLGLEQSYTYLTKWGSTGTGDGEFRHPHNIDVDSSGNLYVTERDNMRVQKFTSGGTFIARWESNATIDGYPDLIIKEKAIRPIFRSNITRNGEFLDPHGIDVNSLGNVYVVDTKTLIQKFDSNGEFLTKWGANGTGNGEFRHPHGIIHDSFDNVYVTDYINANVQKFDSNGKFITKWGINGTGNGEFRHPYGFAVDTLDNVYVSDADNSQIQKFTNDGKFITKWGTNGTGNGEFNSPEGIAVDLEGNVYVTDADNDRIQKFSPRPQYLVEGVNNQNVSGSKNVENTTAVNGTKIDFVGDPFFVLINNASNLPKYWNDSHNSCVDSFMCELNNKDGWVDKMSFQLSTANNTNNTWSWIYGQANPVKPHEKYELLAHMKLNKSATQSHIVLEGFNESSKKWYQIRQCPGGTNGPLEWKEFDCTIPIPENTTKIRPVLNAGWSSQENATAVTLFDAIHLYKVM
jgi:hypothetical protein